MLRSPCLKKGMYVKRKDTSDNLIFDILYVNHERKKPLQVSGKEIRDT